MERHWCLFHLLKKVLREITRQFSACSLLYLWGCLGSDSWRCEQLPPETLPILPFTDTLALPVREHFHNKTSRTISWILLQTWWCILVSILNSKMDFWNNVVKGIFIHLEVTYGCRCTISVFKLFRGIFPLTWKWHSSYILLLWYQVVGIFLNFILKGVKSAWPGLP